MHYQHYINAHYILIVFAILFAIFAIYPPRNRKTKAPFEVPWRDWSWLLFLLAVFFI